MSETDLSGEEDHDNELSQRNVADALSAAFSFWRPGAVATQKLFEGIQFILIHSLKSVKDVIQNDKHCFECYGFDLLIDETLKPWLLEINASPSLSITTKPDRVLKTKLIHDLLSVVVPPDFPSTATSRGCTSWNPALVVGNFELLYSEEMMGQAEREGMPGSGAAVAGSTTAGGTKMMNASTTGFSVASATAAQGGAFSTANATSAAGGGGKWR